MTIIDPMHNLFLGTTKRRMLIIRKDNKILLPEHFKETQKRMELLQCPSLPQKTFNTKIGPFFLSHFCTELNFT